MLYSTIGSKHVFTNIWLMSMMVKIIGVAFDIHLSHIEHSKKKTDSENKEYELNPGFWDIFHYIFSIFGTNVGELFLYLNYFTNNFYFYCAHKTLYLRPILTL